MNTKASKVTHIAILILLTGSVVSCKKWLEEKPDTRLSTPETVKDLQAIIDNGLFINFTLSPSLPEASSDDYFLTQNTIDQGGIYSKAYYWQPFLNGFNNDWRWSYIPVYSMNICLERIEKIPRTAKNTNEWNNVKGSALFLRSYYFLDLLWEYSKAYDAASATSDMGIALRLVSDFNVQSVRASVQQCYNQVINDTKLAASLLPDLAIHPLRPSKAAAYGLLARTYLSMRDYPNAFKYADLSLQINKELIDYNEDADIVADINSSIPPFRQFNKETIFYMEMNSNNPIAKPEFSNVDTILYSQYSTNDLRKAAFFKSNGFYQSFKATYSQQLSIYFTGIATDEMYMIRAECWARLGDKDAAMTDLKTLLDKRWLRNTYVSPVVPDAKGALEIILKERRKELLFRGLRWIDIKRLNKEGYAITPTRIINGQKFMLTPNENRYALLLPQDVVDISGMPQNPQ